VTLFTNRITNRMLDKIIMLVNQSVIFNLRPGDRPSFPFPHFSFFLIHLFLQQTVIPFPAPPLPSPLNLNKIQPPITNPTTTTLGLSVSVFWFKVYWGISTLSKQIYPFFYLNTIFKFYFFAYFCNICILFGCLLIL